MGLGDYDSSGNFINPELVTQDIGTALGAQALGTYNLGPTLSQDTINSMSLSNFSGLLSNPLVLGVVALGIFLILEKRK